MRRSGSELEMSENSPFIENGVEAAVTPSVKKSFWA